MRGHPARFQDAPLDSDGCGIFDPAAVSGLVAAHEAGRAHHGREILRVLGVQLWHRLFVSGERSLLRDDRPATRLRAAARARAET